MTILLWLKNNWKLVAFILSIGGTALATHKIDQYIYNSAETTKELAAAKDTIDALKKWQDSVSAEARKKEQNDGNRLDFEREAIRRNQADRVAGDGPIAPVLLNGMRSISARQAERATNRP